MSEFYHGGFYFEGREKKYRKEDNKPQKVEIVEKKKENDCFTLKAILFDLDGVITNTSEYHFKAWSVIANKEKLTFNREMNKKLLGISRRESLNIILNENGVTSWNEARIKKILTLKNNIYLEALDELSEKDILPGIKELLKQLQDNNIKAVLCSSSKNALKILNKLTLKSYFIVIVNPSTLKKQKPYPDIFLSGLKKAGVKKEEAIGIEDAEAGIKSINSAGILSVGVGLNLNEANENVENTKELTLPFLTSLISS